MRAAQIFILSLCAATAYYAQNAEAACDFSAYKPLVVSHAPIDVIKRVEPQYTDDARLSRAHGQVQVKIIVDREGRVVDACVTHGHPLLREAAKQAALEWRFEKNFGFISRLKRKYIQSWIVFNFRLE